MNMLNPKMEMMDGEQADEGAQDFDMETQKALEEMDALQNEMDIMNINAEAEKLKYEQEYIRQRKPHCNKRNDIIKKIPKFWLTTFRNHPVTASLVTKEEEDCFEHLIKLDVEEYDDIKSGFRVKFYFQKNNPYFDNEVLVKDFPLGTDGKSQGSKINWKEGKNLVMNRNIRGLASEKFRSPPFGIKQPSFFNWFTDVNVHPSEDRYGDAIKDDMWPNPLVYFVLPLEMHVKAAQERYGKEYPDILAKIKSGEYEVRYGQIERDAGNECIPRDSVEYEGQGREDTDQLLPLPQ